MLIEGILRAVQQGSRDGNGPHKLSDGVVANDLVVGNSKPRQPYLFAIRSPALLQDVFVVGP